MAKKRKNNVSYNPIGSINEDWGLDKRNGFPYSGESVQKFIKESLNGKAGLFYYDTTNRLGMSILRIPLRLNLLLEHLMLLLTIRQKSTWEPHCTMLFSLVQQETTLTSPLT